MTNLFQGLFDSTSTSVISVENFIICIFVSLALGAILSFCSKYKNHYSKSFSLSLMILPAIVCIVIMMVNGNIGAGVAIAGAFALVRFRSTPGDAKQIALVFLSMAIGLITGMGYLGYATLFTVLMCIMLFIYTYFSNRNTTETKILKITIPEDLDYSDVFQDIFQKYTASYELTTVKTSNMGSLYKLTYNIVLKTPSTEKEMIDAIRCRNGNLDITCSNNITAVNEL